MDLDDRQKVTFRGDSPESTIIIDLDESGKRYPCGTAGCRLGFMTSHELRCYRRENLNKQGNSGRRNHARRGRSGMKAVPVHTEASDRAKSIDRGVSMKNGLVRIIGGSLRGRSLEFRTHPGTRPMKDRTREALFNLLGRDLTGYCVFDLFAGTGILGIESISRGAKTAAILESVFVADAFRWDPRVSYWNKKLDESESVPSSKPDPWIVYFCPPYSFWLERKDDMQGLLNRWAETCPPGSLLAVEFEKPAPLEMLPQDWDWDIREYLPAIMAIGERKETNAEVENDSSQVENDGV